MERLAEAFGEDPEAIAEFLELVLETGNQHQAALAAAIGASDAAATARVAHSIKGGAGTIGADELAALAKDLEAQAGAGDLSNAAILENGIRGCYRTIALWVANELRASA